MIEFEARKVKRCSGAHAGQVGGNVAAIVFKQQAIPLLQGVVFEVQAGVLGKVRRTQKLAFGRVSPAVQRAHDVAAGAALLLLGQIAPSLQHDRLAVATDVGDQLNPLR